VTTAQTHLRLGDHVRNVAALALFVLTAMLAGGIGGLTTDPAWYQALNRPTWAPPGWLFGPVWTVLYVLMGVAAYWVWRAGGPHAKRALVLYGVQLVLNAAWTPIFFGLRAPAWAFAELVLLWGAIVATMLAFARVRRGAAAMLIPYLAWVTFAGALNLSIALLN
jgi:tryptophan-rich sensory protein